MDAERECKLYLSFCICIDALVVLASCKSSHWYRIGTVVANMKKGLLYLYMYRCISSCKPLIPVQL